MADDRHDPFLVAETIRQATMLVAHAELGVPVDDQFVMWDLHFDADPEALTVNGLSSDVTADVLFPELGSHRGRPRNLSSVVRLSRGGRPLATGGGLADCTSAPAYRRLRGERLAALGKPVPLIRGVVPHMVGRSRPQDVVLGPGPRAGTWQLRIDTGHPTLFRRPNDHVPGMLLLEAARQAATLTVGGGTFLPTVVDISFQRYAELDSPCWIEAEAVAAPDRATTVVRVTGRQDGSSVFVCTLTSPSPELAVAGAGLDRRLAS